MRSNPKTDCLLDEAAEIVSALNVTASRLPCWIATLLGQKAGGGVLWTLKVVIYGVYSADTSIRRSSVAVVLSLVPHSVVANLHSASGIVSAQLQRRKQCSSWSNGECAVHVILFLWFHIIASLNWSLNRGI